MKPNPLLHLVCLFNLIGAVLDLIFGVVLFIACVSWFLNGAPVSSTVMMAVVCVATFACAVLLFVIGRWGDKAHELEKCRTFAVLVLTLSLLSAILSGLAVRFQSSVLIGIVLSLLTLWGLSKQRSWEEALARSAKPANPTIEGDASAPAVPGTGETVHAADAAETAVSDPADPDPS